MILSREGARPRVYGFLFKSVVQSVFLCGAETWVVIPHMGQVLRIFQDQVDWRLTGQLLRQRLDWKWEYTLTATARAEAGFEPMETYIRRRKNTVVRYIATRFLLELCEAVERKQGAWVGMRR